MMFSTSRGQKIVPNEHKLQREIRYQGESGDNLDSKVPEASNGGTVQVSVPDALYGVSKHS